MISWGQLKVELVQDTGAQFSQPHKPSSDRIERRVRAYFQNALLWPYTGNRIKAHFSKTVSELCSLRKREEKRHGQGHRAP